MNYFELFDLPVSPAVDKSSISKKYFELQKKYHPDFFTQSGEYEKEEVLQQSAAINNAYRIFQNQEATIEYFLQTTGLIEAGEKYDLSPDFLMEMMELNETMSEDEESATKQAEAYEEKLWEEVKPIIQNFSEHNTNTTDMQKLKSYFYKKKYIQRILDRLGD